MKLTITYQKSHFDDPATERQIILPFALDEYEGMVSFKMTEEALYDLITQINGTKVQARIRP